MGGQREDLGFHHSPLYQAPPGECEVSLLGKFIVDIKIVETRPLGLAPQVLGTWVSLDRHRGEWQAGR